MAHNPRGPRKRHWMFTSYKEFAPVFDPKVVRYCIYQKEVCPESKRIHLQGYIEFFDNLRRRQVQSAVGDHKCHVEPRMGSRTQARDYCRKDESAVADSQIEFGEWRLDVSRKRKLIDMLKTPDMTLDEFIEEAPDAFVRYHRGIKLLFSMRTAKKAKIFRKVIVTVLVGPTGCGKTRRAALVPDHYFLTGGMKWFDGYESQNCLIIDDFYGNIRYGLFLRLLDGNELQVPIKGGHVWCMWTIVYITSNKHPRDWYKQGLTPALGRRLNNIIVMGDVPAAPVRQRPFNYVQHYLGDSFSQFRG